jgi:hypothetical protein
MLLVLAMMVVLAFVNCPLASELAGAVNVTEMFETPFPN